MGNSPPFETTFFYILQTRYRIARLLMPFEVVPVSLGIFLAKPKHRNELERITVNKRITVT